MSPARIGAGLAFIVALVALVPGHAAARARGIVEGRVVNGSTDRPQGGVEVVLTARSQDDDGSFTRRVTTDGGGRYRFGGLPTGDDRFYTLDAIFDGGTFAGGAITIPDDTEVTPVIETRLRVWPTTRDPGAIVFRSDRSFVVPGEQGIAVIHSVAVENVTDRAYIGRGTGNGDDGTVTLGLPLPGGAAGVAVVDADIDIPELVPITNGAGLTIAIPPGETRISYSYTLAGSAGTFALSRPALYPTLELAIFTRDPLEVSSNRLEARGEVTIAGETYEEWAAVEELDAGDPLQALAVARGGVPTAPLVGAAAVVALVVGAVVLWRRRTPAAEVATR